MIQCCVDEERCIQGKECVDDCPKLLMRMGATSVSNVL